MTTPREHRHVVKVSFTGLSCTCWFAWAIRRRTPSLIRRTPRGVLDPKSLQTPFFRRSSRAVRRDNGVGGPSWAVHLDLAADSLHRLVSLATTLTNCKALSMLYNLGGRRRHVNCQKWRKRLQQARSQPSDNRFPQILDLFMVWKLEFPVAVFPVAV